MSEVQEGRRRKAFGGRGLRQGNPAHDLVGTVRRSPDGCWLAIKLPSPPHPADWTVQDRYGAGGHELPERIWHWPVVGSVPWSPAAGVPLDGSVLTPNTMTATTDIVMNAGRKAMATHLDEQKRAREVHRVGEARAVPVVEGMAYAIGQVPEDPQYGPTVARNWPGVVDETVTGERL